MPVASAQPSDRFCPAPKPQGDPPDFQARILAPSSARTMVALPTPLTEADDSTPGSTHVDEPAPLVEDAQAPDRPASLHNTPDAPTPHVPLAALLDGEDDLQDRTTPLWINAADEAQKFVEALEPELDADVKSERISEELAATLLGSEGQKGPALPRAAAAIPELKPPDPLGQDVIGQVIGGRYRVVDLLARGGMGAVYVAEHVMLRAPVALKLLRSEAQDQPELSERFQREAIVGAHVRHPNVAAATDFGQLPDGSYFLILELVEGRTLEQLLRAGALPAGRAAGIALQIADALSAIHECGVVHRDLKPSNVMLIERAGAGRGRDTVKIIDFGFAKLDPSRIPLPNHERLSHDEHGEHSSRLTSAGVVMGTLPYLAPEAGLGMDAVDARSDLYALGIILYRMLSGQHPFDWKNDAELFQKHVKEPPPPLQQRAPSAVIPEGLEAVVRKLLEKNPEQRYASATLVVEALLPFADRIIESTNPRGIGSGNSLPNTTQPVSTESEAPPPPPKGSEPPDPAPRPIKVRTVVALAVVVLGVAALAKIHLTQPSEPVRAPLPIAPSATQSASRPMSPLPISPMPNSSGKESPSSASASEPAPPMPSASASSAAPLTEKQLADTRYFFSQAVKRQSWLEAYLNFKLLAEQDPDFLSKDSTRNAASNLLVALVHAGIPEGAQMLDMISQKLGTAGLDLLLHVVLFRGNSLAHERAVALFNQPDVMARATPATQIAFRLQVLGCDPVADLEAQAFEKGDGRALLVLGSARQRCPSDPLREQLFRKLEERLSAAQAP